jgi:hypothetical protein
VVNELRAYELLAFVGIGNVFGQGYSRCLRPSAQPSAQALVVVPFSSPCFLPPPVATSHLFRSHRFTTLVTGLACICRPKS